jgi:hypothetical protein
VTILCHRRILPAFLALAHLALAASDILLRATADSLRLLPLLVARTAALRLPRLPFDAVPSRASIARLTLSRWSSRSFKIALISMDGFYITAYPPTLLWTLLLQ